MPKRILVVLLFLPLGVVHTFIECPFYLIRWVITGKEFKDTLVMKLLEGNLIK